MSDWIYNIILPLVTSFVVTFLAIPKIIHFSRLSRLFAFTGERNSHEGEVPVFGGIAIFAGLLFSLIFWSELEEIQFILVSLIIVFFIGVIDDLLSLSPLRKLVGQISSVLVLIYLGGLQIHSMHNLFGVNELPDWIGVLFTIFVVIVVTNAYNLIDGIDGLAGGIGIVSSFAFGVIFLLNNDLQMAIISFTLVGSLLAFLKYNFHPASIFMGDTGSLVIGLILSVLAIRVINNGINIPTDNFHTQKGPFIAISLLAIPLYDTFRVFFIRVLSGYHPLHPDRNHIHHALLDLGFSHKKSSILLYIFSVFIVFISYFMIDMSLGLSIFILSIIVLGIIAVPFILIQIRNKKSEK
ncbi:MAG: undecaprenyl/decaprenyl-phosphate alpha-N-acetylglucosaminyl 1-phosphate transferase [Flavobacteriales bacterium]|nr:undecaprenyl/decaprenyl-phosphate alpha-N-acetylglucosaminyl 1-phosphate transferase [Flavobacteriales bacterium]